MPTTQTTLTSVELFESYVGRGAPPNAAGTRHGYGLTRDQAHRNAAHWPNQAPWARIRKITVSDVSTASGMTSRDERIAWGICRLPDEYRQFTEPTALEKECASLIGKGHYAAAIRLALSRHSLLSAAP